MAFTEIEALPHPNLKVYEATLSAGVQTGKLKFTKVHAVAITVKGTTPLDESFCWSFDSSTKTLTIKSSNAYVADPPNPGSTATVSLFVVGRI